MVHFVINVKYFKFYYLHKIFIHSLYKTLIIIVFITYPNISMSENNYKDWLTQLKIDAMNRNISPQIFYKAMKSAKIIDKIKILDNKQPEKKITFNNYLKRSVSKNRIKLGKINYNKYKDILNKVSKEYNVQARFIVAIWGIETNYGSYTGNFPVISALTTLAYNGRRANFFRNELLSALQILNNNHVKLENMVGSWAGAMGQSQFMPSSYLRYAQDFNNDGKKDIWNDHNDIFASIAYYLKSHGWDNTRTWGREVIIPKALIKNKDNLILKNKRLKTWSELGILNKNGEKLPNIVLKADLIFPDGPNEKSYLIYKNFKKIKKYNNSNYYALAVSILSDGIAY